MEPDAAGIARENQPALAAVPEREREVAEQTRHHVGPPAPVRRQYHRRVRHVGIVSQFELVREVGPVVEPAVEDEDGLRRSIEHRLFVHGLRRSRSAPNGTRTRRIRWRGRRASHGHDARRSRSWPQPTSRRPGRHRNGRSRPARSCAEFIAGRPGPCRSADRRTRVSRSASDQAKLRIHRSAIEDDP